eukprot:Nk52_evm9s302 gene=Nk52_evmTU9s302
MAKRALQCALMLFLVLAIWTPTPLRGVEAAQIRMLFLYSDLSLDGFSVSFMVNEARNALQVSKGSANVYTQNDFGVPAYFAVTHVRGKLDSFDAVVFTSGTYGTTAVYDFISEMQTASPTKKFLSFGSFADKPVLSNLVSFQAFSAGSLYLLGVLSGLYSSTGHVCGISPIDLHPPTYVNALSFFMGAHEANANLNKTLVFMSVGKDSVRTKHALEALKSSGCDVVLCDMLDILCNTQAGSLGMKAIGARSDLTKYVGLPVIGAYSVEYTTALDDFYTKMAGSGFTGESVVEHLWDSKGVKVFFNEQDSKVTSSLTTVTAKKTAAENTYNSQAKPIANADSNSGFYPFCGTNALSPIGSSLACLSFNQYQAWPPSVHPIMGTFQSYYFDDKIELISVSVANNESRALTELTVFVSSSALFPVLCSFDIVFPSGFNISRMNSSTDVSSPNFIGSGEISISVDTISNTVVVRRVTLGNGDISGVVSFSIRNLGLPNEGGSVGGLQVKVKSTILGGKPIMSGTSSSLVIGVGKGLPLYKTPGANSGKQQSTAEPYLAVSNQIVNEKADYKFSFASLTVFSNDSSIIISFPLDAYVHSFKSTSLVDNVHLLYNEVLIKANSATVTTTDSLIVLTLAFATPSSTPLLGLGTQNSYQLTIGGVNNPTSNSCEGCSIAFSIMSTSSANMRMSFSALVPRYADGSSSLSTGQIVGISISATVVALALLILLSWWLLKTYRQRKQIAFLRAEEEKMNIATKARNDFLSFICHELRNPLCGCLGISDMLIDSPDIKATEKDLIRTIHACAALMSTIIDDVLDFSKMEAGAMNVDLFPTNILHLISECLDIQKYTIHRKKNVQFKSDISNKVPKYVEIDGRKIQQILINFLSNAFKFTRSGGSVTVIVKVDNVIDKKEPRTCDLRFEVVDNGTGMTEEESKKLFSKFVQVRSAETRNVTGTGLGLVLCKGFVESMGGKIGCDSEKNVGSTFWFELPNVVIVNDKPVKQSASSIDLHKKATNSLLMRMISIDSDTQAKQDINVQAFEEEEVDNECAVDVCIPDEEDEELKEVVSVSLEPVDQKDRGLNILLVDDDPTCRRVETLLLKSLKANVTCASNGKEGVELLRGGAETFDVVFMDMSMPVMNGYDATLLIRKENLFAGSVIALTGNAIAEEQEKARACGVDFVVTKPVTKGVLQTALSKALGREV